MNTTIGTRSVIHDAKRRHTPIRTKRVYERFKFRKSFRSAKKIQTVFRYFCAHKTKQSPTIIATFFLNPYDKKIDLTSRDGLKLYADAKHGLDKEDHVDGSKEKYSKFSKLMGKTFKTFWMMEIFKVPTV